ncbi:MAG: glyoxalase [Massilia sp.]|jgi:PhnB protein|nr:glyoxalase [Massilia sp.]
MANANVRPIPEGMHALIPHLILANAPDAIDFYKRAFGAVEQSRTVGPNGKVMNAILHIGQGALMLMEENPQWGALGPAMLKGTTVGIHFYVEDVDAAFERAVKEGATPKMPPADMFWGDRFCAVIDPFGHSWSLATHIKDVSPEESQAAAGRMGGDCPDPQ